MPLNESDKLKEEIRFKTEVLKLYTTLFIGTAGGTIALVISKPGAVGNMFIGFGILLSVFWLNMMIRIYKIVQKLIDGDQ
jgi:hypothetical protein